MATDLVTGNAQARVVEPLPCMHMLDAKDTEPRPTHIPLQQNFGWALGWAIKVVMTLRNWLMAYDVVNGALTQIYAAASRYDVTGTTSWEHTPIRVS